ncbi:MAG: hypothetical protein PHF50_02045 [Patescibacteria group bacterium]|nr:hypothetical protein [Patescibacteria group bacterium]
MNNYFIIKKPPWFRVAFYILTYFYLSFLSRPETNSDNAINNNGLADYGLFGA